MAKTLTPDTKQQNASKRKKQAKQEAKAMLKVEQAKKGVQKAERKAAKAQTKLEERRTNLRELEQRLEQARAPQQPETPTSQATQLQPLTIEDMQSNGATQENQAPSVISVPAFDATPGMPATSDTTTSSAPQADSDAISAHTEEQPLTQAESDTTTEPVSEWGDTSKDANFLDDTDLSEGSVSPEDEVVYHLPDDVTAHDPTPDGTPSHSDAHDATTSEHSTDDSASSAASANS